MRLNQLAKEMDIDGAKLLQFLNEHGGTIGSQHSSVTEEQAEFARAKFPKSANAATGSATAISGGAISEKVPPVSKPKTIPKDAPEETDADAPAATEENEGTAVHETETGEVAVDGKLTVKNFAEILDMKPNKVISELMKENVFASINAELKFGIAKKIAGKHGVTLVKKKHPLNPPPITTAETAGATGKTKTAPPIDDEVNLCPRAPIVSFLGHVDHGKTSLLDKIRKTSVTDGESGGITQHIGAYSVEVNDHPITFLDTPGHAAFTAMRARGANLTDIVVLIVAADDGVMPQTREAIQHAKAAEVCIIVAANKMDLPGANLDKLYQGLMEADLLPEALGGEVGVFPVSAMTGEGVQELLERITLEAEMLELKANPKCPADGYVIEARLEPGMGPTATLLIKRGTLKVGDAFISGSCWGKIKALINDKGNKIRTATPSMAVKCMGLNSVPEAGAAFEIIEDIRPAKKIAEERVEAKRQEALKQFIPEEVTLENIFEQIAAGEKKELSVLLKCDVQGSLEAVEQLLGEIQSDKVSLKIILSAVGNITENDVLLARASQAVIMGFHVSKENGVTAATKREGVEVRLYSIIYEMADDVRRAMTGLIDPEYRENVIGQAEIRQIFEIGKRSKIAGCMVIDGAIRSTGKARVKRDDNILYEGSISSLKRFQNDAREVRDGQECGISLDNFVDFDSGDIIECYLMEKLEREL